jgi:tetratricopeptide (TPR) repeat protein
MADDRDPAAHWAMGRALWLRGRHEQSLQELEQAVDLSPNFAMAHYTLAFVRSQSGDALTAIDSAELARQLSPYDPMLFAMHATRALALVRLNRIDDAADAAVKAAARPNAHLHIHALAAFCQALAGQIEDARIRVAVLRKANPTYGLSDFFAAFQLDDPGKTLFKRASGLVALK